MTALSLLAALLLALAGPSAAAEPGRQRANVLVIVADDVGVERIQAYGPSAYAQAKTPTLNALAASGVLFRNAHVNPVCSPTRTAALTGRYAFRTGIGTSIGFEARGGVQPMASELTLAERASRTHYSAVVGKWHLGIAEAQGGSGFMHPIEFGFDLHIGNIKGKLDDYFAFDKNIASARGHIQVPVRRYATTDEVDDTLALIDRLSDTPWFVWLAFHAPHNPFHVPPTELTTINVHESSPIPVKHRAMTEAMDTEIGRLLTSIEPDVLARTWIVFLGDNGTPAQALGPLATGKSTLFQLGINVPLIVAGPGVAQPGREVDALVDAPDIYATVLDMLGQPPAPQAVDSISFYRHLVDPAAARLRPWSYSVRFRPNGPPPYELHRRAIRGPRYKLIRRQSASGALPAVQFFDVANDPAEIFNLLPGLTPEEQAAFDALDAQLLQLGG